MSNVSILELKAAILDVFEVEFEELTYETTAPEVNGWDSLGHFRLLHYLEEKYSIEFEIEDLGSMNNIGDLIRIINDKI